MLKFKSVLFLSAVILLFSLFMVNTNSFASEQSSNGETSVSSSIKSDDSQSSEEEENNSEDPSVEVTGLVGGGVLKCEGDGYAAALCNISLTSVEPLSYGNITITYYKVESNGSLTNVGYHILEHYPQGSSHSFYDQDSKILPGGGKYQAKATGWLETSYGKSLTVSSIWSTKFTVEN
ncbi:hypothetical protein [Bacillus testis]|uniref:hypothetical protein n=1 Tax=Bacillus testis TaxID=1622072 RepID=UPI00067E6BC3|nr:hypothetical protein [Bacillus testis]